MSLVMVGVEKGGVGKSTITQNLASIRASLGFRVVILDLDNQATSAKWVTRRIEDPELPQVDVKRLKKGEGKQHLKDFAELVQELVDTYDEVFLDVGGQDTAVFRASLAAADIIVAPLIPSPADLDTVPDLADIVTALKTKKDLNIKVVLNQASGSPRMLRDMKAGLKEFDDVLPLLPKTVGSRVAFKYAMAKGKGVHELTAKEGFDANAAHEMKDLYLGVFGK